MLTFEKGIENLVFDMDDTLTATNVEIHSVLSKFFIKNKKYQLLEEMNSHLKNEGGLTLPQEIRDYAYHEVIKKEEYMLNVKPTMLFFHFFIRLMYLPKNKNVSICTHRGFSANGLAYTKQWLEKYNKHVCIKDIHCLDSKETPDKLAYLKEVYGDNFYLIDDNPLHDLSKVYEPMDKIIIYDKYGKYNAYQKQKRLTYSNGEYAIVS